MARFVIVTLMVIGGFTTGILLYYKRRKWCVPTAIGCSVAIALYTLLNYFYVFAAKYLVSDLYVLIETTWGILFAFIALGMGVCAVKTIVLRDIAYVAAGVGICFIIYRSSFGMYPIGNAEIKGTINEGGVCRQTTIYTCGSAAAVMLLYSKGITATENEMFALTRASFSDGTSVAGMVLGLGRKYSGNVRVEKFKTDGSEFPQVPFAAVIKLNALVDHWIIIDKISEEEFDTRNPVSGRVTISRKSFLDSWRGVAVWLD